MKKIYYIGHYSDPNVESNRKAAPAADTKMDYIINAIKNIGLDIEVLSFCSDDERIKIFEKKKGYETKKNNVNIRFFDNYASKLRVLRVISRYFSWIKVKKFLKEKCLSNDCIVLIYHSLALMKVINYFNRKNKKIILEMEEIYSDVINKKNKRKQEITVASKADAYIFPTELLDKKVNIGKKPSAIIYGTYQVEEERDKKLFSDEKIHCVYAGTFDPRKGGAIAAVKAAQYLDENYHMHIIGFGSEEDKINLLDEIEKVKKATKATVTYDGLFSGEEYIEFIQSCDIGLSTQNPNAAFNDTSFPSKILSYLANGLRVVSIRIPVVETSKIGDMLFYYEKQTPQEIAKAIMSVDMKKEYNSRNRISELDKKFTDDITKLLN